WLDETFGINHSRNPVFVEWQFSLSSTGSAMICHNNEDGIGKPRLFPCEFKEFFDGIIGIFYTAVPRFGSSGNINSSFRIGERSVVRNRHPMMEERFSRFRILIHHLN